MMVYSHFRRVALRSLFVLVGLAGPFASNANPTGGIVSQGQASFSTSGSTFNINQTSANAFINWQSFNINSGETVNFNQPSASSVTWNQIGGGSASQILGTINANGYVILQNSSGFYIGGSATINAHGLVMTTASTPAINILGSSPWSFSAPPPTAKIVNYGQINIAGGGSVFLIASDIENNGTISAPGGNIGLYAGENVLVSSSPDGRGLSAQVTLPQGSVDNEGKLIADAGTIVAEAQYVNQNGLIQANTVQNNNGTIELVASDNLTLGANSQISANGDPSATGASEGGFVVLEAGSKFSDTSSSTISASGTAGGQDGVVDILGNGVGTVNSTINDNFAVLINPYDMTLSSSGTSTSETPFSDPNFNVGDLSAYSKIDLWALDNIEVSTFWTLPGVSAPGALNLNAGNNFIVDDGCGIGTTYGGSYDWNLNFSAGTQLPYGTIPTAGNDGIYLNGAAEIYTFSGDINLWAANEVIVAGGSNIGAVQTFNGGNISVTAVYGNVYTGANANGYDFSNTGYLVDFNLGGISTYAGGNVNINAGGDVISYLPYELPVGEGESLSQLENAWASAAGDAGCGAFGSEPGNVTITAGGNVYGHYVVANGVGTITAGGNVGVPLNSPNQTTDGFALSLINGSWSVFAPNGSIYVQDINNPNGLFNDNSGSSYHNFDYSASSSVLLDAGNNVEFTGSDAPQAPPSVAIEGNSMPMLLPSSLTVIAGGNFTLDTSVILFPSPDQNLSITAVGNFTAAPNGNPVYLEMSDSAATSWKSPTSFGPNDHASTPPEVNNPNPVNIVVGENVQDVTIYTDKATDMNVIGNMMDSSFIGENMLASDQTIINVLGNIEFSSQYAFVNLPSAILSAEALMPGTWDSVFDFAVNPNDVAAITSFNANNPGANGLAYYLKQNNYLLFPTTLSSTAAYGSNPGFVYDAASLELGYKGQLGLSAAQLNALESGSITVLVTDSHGNPIINSSGNLEVKTYTFNWGSVLPMLKAESQNDINNEELGFQIGGPGQFVINAASMNLGASFGIVSAGFGEYGVGAPNYGSLEGICGALASGGASVSVNVGGDLNMASSTICSLDGGPVDVTAAGNINLSQGDFALGGNAAYGIWTSGHSDVNVIAAGNINIGTSRIATFNGGNVFVESTMGSVDCGIGANVALSVYGVALLNGVPTGDVEFGDFSNPTALTENPAPYGSGILAEYPTSKYQTPGATGPGNITVETPNGNITSSSGGIFELALGNSFAGGTVTLTAGQTGTPATVDQGNINLGGPVIGGTLNITATGKSHVVALARQNLNLTANEFSGTLVAEGTANVTAQSSGGPTVVIGGGGVDANGLGPTAILLSQNVSADGGSSQSTLGTSVATSSSSAAASQQSSQQAAQVATSVNTDQTDNKKEKPKVRVGRVTVILSSAAPLQKESTFADSTTAAPVSPVKSSGLIATIR